MRKIVLSLVVIYFLIGGLGVLAQNNNLPSPGITPDSPFYFIKSWKESIQLFFTFGAENKAKQFLHLSEIRLAEYLKMTEKGKTEIAQRALDKYEKQLNQALEKSNKVSAAKSREAISEKILKHQEVLKNVMEKVPEAAKPGIEKAIEASQDAQSKIIEEGLKQASPEVQGCVKSMISKVSGGEIKGVDDIQTMLLNCLAPGAKIPSGGWLNMESLKKIEEFYGKSLSPKDLESLKKAQELLKGKIPQGTTTPSGENILDLESAKKIQEKMQEDLQEEYKKMTPEELEWIKKTQEQQENIAPPEIPGGNSGMGL